jgi:hypothetical protein
MSLRRHLCAAAREALESLSQEWIVPEAPGAAESSRQPTDRAALGAAFAAYPLSLYAVVVVSMRACPRRLMLFYRHGCRRAGARFGSVIR